LCHEGQFEVADDLVDDSVIFDEGDNLHLTAALRTEKRIDLIKGKPPILSASSLLSALTLLCTLNPVYLPA